MAAVAHYLLVDERLMAAIYLLDDVLVGLLLVVQLPLQALLACPTPRHFRPRLLLACGQRGALLCMLGGGRIALPCQRGHLRLQIFPSYASGLQLDAPERVVNLALTATPGVGCDLLSGIAPRNDQCTRRSQSTGVHEQMTGRAGHGVHADTVIHGQCAVPNRFKNLWKTAHLTLLV
jgi:hypothetical protein